MGCSFEASTTDIILPIFIKNHPFTLQVAKYFYCIFASLISSNMKHLFTFYVVTFSMITLKTSAAMMLILLSLSISAATIIRKGNEPCYNIQSNDSIIQKGTPVYEGNENHKIAILEIDYPKVAHNFVTAFPGTSNQLWIKEGKNLFVYFSNNGNKVSAVFTINGRMSYAISIIGLSGVLEGIKNKIKKEYHSFSFFSAKKIQANGYTAYELVFENCHEFITISTTDDNEIVLTKKMLKTTSDKICGCRIP